MSRVLRRYLPALFGVIGIWVAVPAFADEPVDPSSISASILDSATGSGSDDLDWSISILPDERNDFGISAEIPMPFDPFDGESIAFNNPLPGDFSHFDLLKGPAVASAGSVSVNASKLDLASAQFVNRGADVIVPIPIIGAGWMIAIGAALIVAGKRAMKS